MRTIEFVFRVDTDTDDESVLDDVIQHGSETLFPDYYNEDILWDGPKLYYKAEGSHWREVGGCTNRLSNTSARETDSVD